MFPIGIRILKNNKLIYPVEFLTGVDSRSGEYVVKTKVEGDMIESTDVMVRTQCMAINGPVFERDIVEVNIDGELVVGTVRMDESVLSFYIEAQDRKITLESGMSGVFIIGFEEDEKVVQTTTSNEVVTDNTVDLEKKAAVQQVKTEDVEVVAEPALDKEEILAVEQVKEEQAKDIEGAIEETEKIEESEVVAVADKVEMADGSIDGQDVIVNISTSTNVKANKTMFVSAIVSDGEKVTVDGIVDGVSADAQLKVSAAVIAKLGNVKNVTIVSDDDYVISPFQRKFIEKWIKDDWIKSNGKKVQNSELWKTIFDMVRDKKVVWVAIKDIDGEPELLECKEAAIKKANEYELLENK